MLLFECAVRLEGLLLLVEDLLLQGLHPAGANLVKRLLPRVPAVNHDRLVYGLVQMISLSHLNVELRLLPQVVVSRVIDLTLVEVLADFLSICVLVVYLLFRTLVSGQLGEVELGNQLANEPATVHTALVAAAAPNVLVGVLGVETKFVVRLTVTRFERSFKGAHNLVEAVSGQRLEVVFLVDLVDRNAAVHLQAVQEKEQLRQLLRLVVLALLPVS